MKILQISSARTLGGGERHLADLALQLARRGHEVHVALAPGSPLRAELSTLPRRQLHIIAPRHALDVVSASRLARVLRENAIEILHAHMARDYPVAALAARRAPGARLVITRHVLFPLNRVHRIVLSNVSRVIAVSSAVERTLQEQKIFPAGRLRVVPNAIDVEACERAAREAGRELLRRELRVRAPLLVGSVGELSPVKGHEEFLRAASIVARARGDAVEFVILGEDAARARTYRARLEKLSAEWGLAGRVHLPGHRADVARALPSLDLFVSASRTEAFGLAILEAMACGVPVLATATEGARELVEDGVTGRMVPTGDAEALAAAMGALLDDAHARASLAARAQAVARERYNLARMVSDTLRVYEEALGE